MVEAGQAAAEGRRVLVLGGTGGTGREIVRGALGAGFNVAGFVVRQVSQPTYLHQTPLVTW